jgi:hypothetical protein
MDEPLTYWMEYTGKWSYRIVEVPSGEVEAFTRQHQEAHRLSGDGEQLAKDKLNEQE